MKKLTKKAFLQDTEHAELFRKVLNQTGLSWSDIIANPIDYRDAANGVNGFIYYADTVKFAKQNILLILDLLHRFEDEIGEPLESKPNLARDGETIFYNWLSWFALESCIDSIIQQLEL